MILVKIENANHDGYMYLRKPVIAIVVVVVVVVNIVVGTCY